MLGTGAGVEYGYDEHLGDFGSMQGARACGGIQFSPPASGAATIGKTRTWRFRNPVEVAKEKTMGMVREFYFMGR